LAYYYNNFYFEQNIKKYNYHPDIILKSKSFKFNVYQQKEDKFNNKVIIDKTIEKNRSFYWCPAIQV
jgi:formamidopyrimidine-DNA glycosylase